MHSVLEPGLFQSARKFDVGTFIIHSFASKFLDRPVDKFLPDISRYIYFYQLLAFDVGLNVHLHDIMKNSSQNAGVGKCNLGSLGEKLIKRGV